MLDALRVPGPGGRIPLQRYSLSVIVPFLLLLLWEAAVRTDFFPSTLLAAPSEVVVKFVERTADLSLFKHALVSVRRITIGFALGTSLGIFFGVLVGASRFATRLVEPTILSLIPIPGIAWIPLLIIVFGIGEVSKISLIMISGFSTLFIPTAYGIRTADKNLVEVALVLGKSQISTLRYILLPSAVPSILSGMRVTMVAAWTLMISAEIVASSEGLGWFVWDARRFSRPDDMIVGMISLGILGKSTDYLLVRLERYLTRYRQTYRDITDV